MHEELYVYFRLRALLFNVDWLKIAEVHLKNKIFFHEIPVLGL